MSLATTVLVDAVIEATDRYTKYENRVSDMDVLGIAARGTQNLVNSTAFADLRKSERRPVKIPVLQRYNPTVRTARQITETPGATTSAFVTPTWSTVGGAVGLTQAVNEDNYISSVQDLSHQIFHLMRRICDTIDTNGVTFLEAGKYATPAASSLPGVTVASGAYELEQEKFYQYLPTIMKKLDIQGPYSIVSNVEGLAELTRMSTLSTYNQQNIDKLRAGYEFGYSKNISAGTGYIQKSYVLPVDSFGMIQWTEADCRRGIDTPLLKYYEMPITLTTPSGYPITLNFGVKYSAGPTDMSGTIAGLERAFTEQWGLYVDIAFIKEYSSDTTSPIVKFNLPTPA